MDLGRRGCQGTPRDFAAWVHFETGVEDPSVPAVLDNLVSAGKFKHHPGFDHEYILASPIEFQTSVRYKVSGELKQSPIQMVRSCMEAFLRSQGTADETLMDISIATTEAMENAVKYSDHSPIEVSYSVENGVFHIMIKNRLSEVRLEKDIEAGKYTSTTTLMRGMMVMVKLFDEMDIEILEEEKLAVFQAHKRIK
ncbi:MAG TPA: ATP-binding protein [Leptospiraceae bacterium]|nr:ATP-binding protein [Leptospirales bacterium]HMW61958.1 ATP-binding protein [Leptospiraceae bacterium]HMX57770.1 ATP-binding protein [Leptospiraceae bacterium]HNL68337.1 ATP-binding protein [Leptospiraceae bacterium]HNN60598.1 ATP-binding protein [Leptospiraceae bacterium]